LLPALRIPLPFAPFVPPSALTSLATGLTALDAVLPGRGIPKGRLTEIVGVLGSGRTTLVRQLAKATIARGLRVACVDATRTLDPRGWAGLCAAGAELLVVRPQERARGAWCADILLRSGAFALVVLDGAPPLSRSVTVRLTRLARDAEAAFVVVGDELGSGATGIPGALRLRTEGHQRRRASRSRDAREGRAPDGLSSFVVTVEKGGASQRVEVSSAIGWTRRLCTHPEVPDRRGVAPARSGGAARAATRGGDTGGDVRAPLTADAPFRDLDAGISVAGRLAALVQ
jgi:recombination protein RecA